MEHRKFSWILFVYTTMVGLVKCIWSLPQVNPVAITTVSGTVQVYQSP